MILIQTYYSRDSTFRLAHSEHNGIHIIELRIPGQNALYSFRKLRSIGGKLVWVVPFQCELQQNLHVGTKSIASCHSFHLSASWSWMPINKSDQLTICITGISSSPAIDAAIFEKKTRRYILHTLSCWCKSTEAAPNDGEKKKELHCDAFFFTPLRFCFEGVGEFTFNFVNQAIIIIRGSLKLRTWL